ncbi:hypothetical protein [Paraburkholderia sp. RL17-373-BIF-A]|uniref:hypothetical protein n=1 Tax=Paraburkholderia sp. RL17-373-BIF-A TaxID=3031629 RepID=UPI0038BC396E
MMVRDGIFRRVGSGTHQTRGKKQAGAYLRNGDEHLPSPVSKIAPVLEAALMSAPSLLRNERTLQFSHCSLQYAKLEEHGDPRLG